MFFNCAIDFTATEYFEHVSASQGGFGNDCSRWYELDKTDKIGG